MIVIIIYCVSVLLLHIESTDSIIRLSQCMTAITTAQSECLCRPFVASCEVSLHYITSSITLNYVTWNNFSPLWSVTLCSITLRGTIFKSGNTENLQKHLSCVTHISGREWHDKVLSYIQYINQLVLLLMSHLCSVYVTAFSCSTHGDCESRNTEQNKNENN